MSAAGSGTAGAEMGAGTVSGACSCAAAAAGEPGSAWWRVGPALLVSLALQVGVNYANDYSDGIRGTDRERVGPVRLVGQGLASLGSALFGGMPATGARPTTINRLIMM